METNSKNKILKILKEFFKLPSDSLIDLSLSTDEESIHKIISIWKIRKNTASENEIEELEKLILSLEKSKSINEFVKLAILKTKLKRYICYLSTDLNFVLGYLVLPNVGNGSD
ncbi:hypothetical protein TSEDIMI_370003 [Tenacibaculum sediminilitoris]|uniref:hypothetical protein n=1 Tax=Tenacibaculum sediminilitoris TaxID=1820334 RepID=UPI003893D39A